MQFSKTFSIYKKGDLSVSLTPKVNTAIINNYYKKDGLSQITEGVDLGISKGKFSINASVNVQDGKIKGMEDFTWYTISTGYKF